MQVYKYALRPDEGEGSPEQGFKCTLLMNRPAEVLAVEVTSRGPALFALAEPEAELEERGFFVVGNGSDLPQGEIGQYVGTAKVAGGPTFHAFELLPVPVGA